MEESIKQVKDEIYKLYASIYTCTPKEVSNLIFGALNNFQEALKILSEQDKK